MISERYHWKRDAGGKGCTVYDFDTPIETYPHPGEAIDRIRYLPRGDRP